MNCSMPDCNNQVGNGYSTCFPHRYANPPEDARRAALANVHETLWKRAIQAGKDAAEACTPTPMIVHDPRTGQVYAPVTSGVCGFASIRLLPATTPFVRWLKKRGIGYKAYRGGWEINISGYGQSMELKQAYARAAAEVLKEEGLRAYARSRMD